MTSRIFILLLTLTTAFTGCNIDTCELETQNWKENAGQTLNEFKEVEGEIKTHQEIFKKDELWKQRLFLRVDDALNIEKKYGIKLPKLKKWFMTKDQRFISYDYANEIISATYKVCNSGTWSYSAYLYYSQTGLQPSFTRNLIAEIKDSISLGDNWYFIRTKCKGCDN